MIILGVCTELKYSIVCYADIISGICTWVALRQLLGNITFYKLSIIHYKTYEYIESQIIAQLLPDCRGVRCSHLNSPVTTEQYCY